MSSEQIVEAARRDASEFLGDYGPAVLFGPGREAAIRRFLHEKHQLGVYNVSSLPKPNYASWLCKLGFQDAPGGTHTGWCAAINRTLIHGWSEKSKIPPHALVVRSVLHEHGHMRYSPNTKEFDPAKPPFVNPASPEEEGAAWEYALAFIGAVLAQHATSRRRNLDIDDTPIVQF